MCVLRGAIQWKSEYKLLSTVQDSIYSTFGSTLLAKVGPETEHRVRVGEHNEVW